MVTGTCEVIVKPNILRSAPLKMEMVCKLPMNNFSLLSMLVPLYIDYLQVTGPIAYLNLFMNQKLLKS